MATAAVSVTFCSHPTFDHLGSRPHVCTTSVVIHRSSALTFINYYMIVMYVLISNAKKHKAMENEFPFYVVSVPSDEMGVKMT
jgi:hypothetical protein